MIRPALAFRAWTSCARAAVIMTKQLTILEK